MVRGPGPYFDGPSPWTRSTEGVHVFYFPILRDIENDLKFANASFNQILNVLSNVASAFKNNYGVLESVSNGLKNAVPYFQCILDLSLYAGFSSIESHVNRLMHPTEMAIRRLVLS